MNNNTTAVYTLLERYTTWTGVYLQFAPASVWTERVVPPVLYVIGFIGNPLAAIVWLGQVNQRNNSCAVYLGVLSINDMFVLVLHNLYFLHMAWGYVIYNRPMGCEMFNFTLAMLLYISDFLVVAFTFERYMAVCHPILKLNLLTVRRAVSLVLAFIAASACLATAQIYIWTYSHKERICIVRREDTVRCFANNWSWVTIIVFFILIPLLVLVLNILVLNKIISMKKNDVTRHQRAPRVNSATSTVTLLGVSFFFIITQLSVAIVIIIHIFFSIGDITLSDENIRKDKTWSRYFTYVEVEKVIEVIYLSHFASYSFIYCMTGKTFRQEVVYLLTHRRLPSGQHSMTSQQQTQEPNTNLPTDNEESSEIHLESFSTKV